MEKIKLDKKSDIPLYIQLYERIKNLIEDNQFKKDKLPSIRNLAKA